MSQGLLGVNNVEVVTGRMWNLVVNKVVGVLSAEGLLLSNSGG